MTKKIIALSVATTVSLFAQSELEEVKALLEQQIKVTQALQKRLSKLEAQQKHLAKAEKKHTTEIKKVQQKQKTAK
jgi:Tfp pilus assembly protein PilN